MNQIIVNNVNALVAALQNLSDKDMELKRKDVLLDLGHNGHSRQYLQVSYMYDVGDKISDTLRGFYLQAEQVSVRIMRTRRGSLMPVKTRSGRGFTSLLTEAGRWSDNRFKSLPTERPDHLYWSSRAGHFYLRIFILQWTHSIVGCMRPFKIVIMNELRDFLFNNVFIHGRSVT